MSLFQDVLLKIKRGQSPGMRRLRAMIRFLMAPPAPRVPGMLRPLFGSLYELHFMVIRVSRTILNLCYRHPLFQGRCKSIGHGVQIDQLPFVYGPVEIEIGDHTQIGGNISIMSGYVFDQPRLTMGKHVFIGWHSFIAVNREVVIEDHVMISHGVRISDNDGHPKEADRRSRHEPADAEATKPVHIKRYAWIGNGAHIHKGVTIGEGAIIGANSVVLKSVPPFALAAGNPARVIRENVGRPSVTTPWPEDQPL